MNKKRFLIIILISLMAIGFAAVSTVLYLNGTVSVTSNADDYDVYYSNVKVNGTIDKSVVVDEKHISFIAEMNSVGDEYKLEYYITNGSRNYDANVSMACSSGNNYVTITNSWENNTIITSTNTKSGLLTIKMIKSYTGDETLELNVECQIIASASERNSLGVGTPADKAESGLNLYDLIAANASNEVVDYSEDSHTSGTHGVYITTATEGNTPVYYFRGDANKVNNNLIFNNMCWKIIRTTETGGVKLIYNGLPDDGKCEATGAATYIGQVAFNNNDDDNAYVGYMYGTPESSTYAETHANINDSTIKAYVDNWYVENFDADASSKLEDTVFCNDRSTKAYDPVTISNTSLSNFGALGYDTNLTIYSAAHRVSQYSINTTPTLVCSQANDKFTVGSSNGNGALTYPVGLITSDEVILAGFDSYMVKRTDNENQNNYLFSGATYWTLTPIIAGSNGTSYLARIGYDVIEYMAAEYDAAVRPVVSLAPSTIVALGGEGTSSNPYVVK